jgi:hypothetical protein
MTQALSLNEHLELEMAKHPDRSYFATLLASQPQFSPNNLQAEIQGETEYWMSMLNGADAPSFLQTFEGVRHAFDALKHEASALKDIEKAMVAHGKAEWAEAGICYGKAVSDLHFALIDWSFAIHEVADDTPFDPYYPTKAEREKRNVEDPPRASYQDMCAVSPYLFRIYRNMDRIFCIGQELVQRQITCLTTYMQLAEEQEAVPRSRPDNGTECLGVEEEH